MAKKLLVIEDDADSRLLLEEILSMTGHEVTSAENVEEVMARLAESTPDVIISDLCIPGAGRNGEIVSIIREHTANAQVRIVLLSGHADLRALSHSLGVEYLAKPVDIDSILKLAH